MRTNALRLSAAALSVVALTAACGSKDKASDTASQAASGMPSHASTAPAAATGGADSAAAGLRGALTGLLEDHVWLAGNALQTAVLKGGNLNDPQVKGAVAALDGNSVALSKAVGSVYPAAEKPFLASWRQHIGFFVEYTLGKATKDQAKVAKATKELDGYRTSFGQLIHSVVPNLPADAVANELKPHVASLFAAIDAAVAGDPSFQSKLTTAAEHMPMTAAILAGGIAKDKGLS
jgi:hypothetical protein